MDANEVKKFILDLIEEEFAPKPIEIAKKWHGGSLTLNPGNDTQAKEIPLDIFFKKLIGVKEALRVLEQKINNYPSFAEEEKISFQAYFVKAYGTLTSFNILFKEDRDKFVGAGKINEKNDSNKSNMSVAEAKRKLGLNEY